MVDDDVAVDAVVRGVGRESDVGVCDGSESCEVVVGLCLLVVVVLLPFLEEGVAGEQIRKEPEFVLEYYPAGRQGMLYR